MLLLKYNITDEYLPLLCFNQSGQFSLKHDMWLQGSLPL